MSNEQHARTIRNQADVVAEIIAQHADTMTVQLIDALIDVECSLRATALQVDPRDAVEIRLAGERI